MEKLYWIVAAVAAGLIVVKVAVRAVIAFWWKPLQLKRNFESQGIRGPPSRILFGNAKEISRMAQERRSKPMQLSHDILPRILPYYNPWVRAFGKSFVYWFGPTPRLNVEDPELIREILTTNFGHYAKPGRSPLVNHLVGNHGIATVGGEDWARHRRILNPAFYADNLKGMIPEMVASVSNMLDGWVKSVASGNNEIEIYKDFCNLTADVIARTAFGTSYVEGKRIFDLQAIQTVLVAEAMQSAIYVPGSRFLPTRKNRYRWRAKREIERSLKDLIESREESVITGKSDCYGNDLLGIMMKANKAEVQGGGKGNRRLSTEELMDDCKTFFFAGRETTSSLLTWTMVLLGMYPTWQDKARKEVIEICGYDVPADFKVLSRLKTVGMILSESLRLYPPLTILTRQIHRDMNIAGKLSLPKGIQIAIPIIAIQRDPDIWGEDGNEFNPERFGGEGASRQNASVSYLPFSMGPRICVGQNFALQEAKLAVAMILQRFTFQLSPTYVHAPIAVMMLEPQFGAQIILHRL